MILKFPVFSCLVALKIKRKKVKVNVKEEKWRTG